jgi:hypothetical protein
MASTRRQRIAHVERKLRAAPRPNLMERRMSKFLRQPPSVRVAASVIVTATALVVVGGGALIRLVDHSEYPNVWIGMWWALQTATTVGYGDVTPAHTSGRLVAVLMMLEGVAFLAIITAAITSSFVARAGQERLLAEATDEQAFETRVETTLAELIGRFDRLESTLATSSTSNDAPSTP